MDETRGVDDSPNENNPSRINCDDNYNLDPTKTELGNLMRLDQDESANFLSNLAPTTTPFLPALPKLSERSLQNNFPVDPMMRQAYALPPAGAPTRRLMPDLNAANRKYNMASDIFGTGMDKSWVNEQPNSTSQTNLGLNAKEPGSFKITQTSNNPNAMGHDALGVNGISAQPQNRRARESAGNPLTGTGYDDSNNKTAKRYFEGSNSNQKLW
ncbi:hypothetical protein Ocin01_00758 [Orchesella cincta]|uniref:Uncharacterized protein n=1 Tax=Orchesella cincta TaxID=48709 RepID=A0A1D2NLG0_ORCCI|nr:hypothetical protein Ocin01_00758 [Orchesella cincta]